LYVGTCLAKIKGYYTIVHIFMPLLDSIQDDPWHEQKGGVLKVESVIHYW
jgi:hypothetical protein